MAEPQPKPDSWITLDGIGLPWRRKAPERDGAQAPEGNPHRALAEAERRVRAALAAADPADRPLREDAARVSAAEDQVVLPILERSEQLAEVDLIAIAEAGGETRRQVIARRQDVGARLAEVLIEAGERSVVLALLRNPEAEIGKAALNRIIDGFKRDREIGGALVRRPCLPVSVIERLVALVTDEQRDYLLSHHRLPADARRGLVLHGRERATVGMLAEAADGEVVSHNPRAVTGAAARTTHGPGAWAAPPRARRRAGTKAAPSAHHDLMGRPPAAPDAPAGPDAPAPRARRAVAPTAPAGPADSVDLGDLVSLPVVAAPASTRAAKGKARKRKAKR